MVKVEIKPEELAVLDKLFADATCPIGMGLLLGRFRERVQEELDKESNK